MRDSAFGRSAHKKFIMNEKRRRARNMAFQKGVEAERNGDDKKALEYYRMSLQADSEFFDSWLNAGAVYSRLGKTKKAIICYQRAVTSREDKRAYYNLASEYFKAGRYTEAEKMLGRTLNIDSNFLQAHLLLGYTYGRQGRNDHAEKSIKNALDIDSENRPALTALALLYFHSGRRELALRYINRLLGRYPEDRIILRLKANLTLDDGDITESISLMKKMAAEDPDLEEFHRALDTSTESETRREIRNRKENLEQKKGKDSRDWFDLSLLSFFDGDPEKALDYLAKSSEDEQ